MKKVALAVLVLCLSIGVPAANAAEKVVTMGIYQEPENLNTYIGVQTVITYVHKPFAEYLIDALIAKQKGESPWSAWQDRLPPSYFERRWGSAWKDTDKDFWDKFRASVKARQSKKKNKADC